MDYPGPSYRRGRPRLGPEVVHRTGWAWRARGAPTCESLRRGPRQSGEGGARRFLPAAVRGPGAPRFVYPPSTRERWLAPFLTCRVLFPVGAGGGRGLFPGQRVPAFCTGRPCAALPGALALGFTRRISPPGTLEGRHSLQGTRGVVAGGTGVLLASVSPPRPADRTGEPAAFSACRLRQSTSVKSGSGARTLRGGHRAVTTRSRASISAPARCSPWEAARDSVQDFAKPRSGPIPRGIEGPT